MREGTNRLRIGALLLGVGLAFTVAAPALAQEVPGISVDEGDDIRDADEVTITTDDYVVTADDPSTIEPVDTRTTQEIFTEDLLDCIGDIGVSDAVTGVLENVLDEEEVTESDLTPFNPIDEGSIVEDRVYDCDADPL
jgi:hypothetical protein